MAFVGASALATGSTSITPVYASATAGDLLVCLVSADLAAATQFTISGATAGWVQRAVATAPSTPFLNAEIWEKIATGNDTMPTWNGGTNAMAGIVAEFSNTIVFDQLGTAIGTTSPVTVTSGGVDGGTGRLIVVVVQERQAAGATTTWSHNVNGLGVGTGINVLGDNGASSQNGHHNSIYVTTAVTGSSADNDVATWTATSTKAALAIASYTVVNTTTVGLSGVLREDYNRAGTVWSVTPKDVWREEQPAVNSTEDSWNVRVRAKGLGAL